MTLKGLSGRSYQLAAESLGSGGEGGVYSVLNAPDRTAKIYHANRISQEQEQKLRVMYSRQPDPSVLTQVAWPLDLLYDGGGNFRGFLMPRLDTTNELGDIYAYPPTLNIPYGSKLIIAQNICAVISAAHDAGYVFGDFNPRNIGVNINTGLVAFFDTDSYHITSGGRTYRCTVGTDGYIAPELLKKCAPYKNDAYVRAPLPTFTRETDNFALAIHIFRLLMNGFTPFSGVKETDTSSSPSPGLGNEAVARDNYCFKPGNRPLSAAVPPLEILPRQIANLFTRAFVHGRIDPAQRPNALEWHAALMRYESSLVTCPRNSAHMYQKGLPSCPWCEADNRFNGVYAPKITQRTIPRPQVTAPPSSGGYATGPSVPVYTPPVSQPPSFGASAGGPPYTPPPYAAPAAPQKPVQHARFRKRRVGAGGTKWILLGLIAGALASLLFFFPARSLGPSGPAEEVLSEPQVKEYLPLRDLSCVQQSHDKGKSFEYYKNVRDNLGSTYEEGIGGYGSGQSWKEYQLDGTYQELRGRVVLNYDARAQTSDEVFLWIYGDGIALYMSQPVTAGCEPQDFTVDISSVTTLRVAIQGSNMLRLVDCGLYKDSSVPTVSTRTGEASGEPASRVYLSSLDWFTAAQDGLFGESSMNGGAFQSYDVVKDNFGTTYANGISGMPGYESSRLWQEYRLEGKYREMQGRVVLNYDARAERAEKHLSIYGDGELLFQSNAVNAGYEPQDFTIDLSGVTTLKVEIDGSFAIRLVDCILSAQ